MQRLRPWIVLALALASGCKKKPMDWAEEGSGSNKPSPFGSGSDQGSGSAAEPSPSTAKHAIAAAGDALDAATTLSVAPEHACAMADEKVWCWDPGQSAAQQKTPKALTTIAGASCGLNDSGELYCWSPKELTAQANALGGQVIVGSGEICVGHRMQIKCWRSGDAEPHAQFDWAGVDKLVLGDGKVCSAVSGGTVECADLSRKEVHAESVPGPQDLAAFAMAGALSCGAYTKGNVECWTDATKRKPVPTVEKATDIAVGPTGDACALYGSGFVKCWHADSANGTVIEASVKEIGGVRNASAIGVGVGYGCVINGDNKIACWGKASKEPLVAQTVSKK